MSREEDIEIAIALFGAYWRGTPRKQDLFVPGLGDIVQKRGKDLNFIGYQTPKLPAYTSDPAADYSVLKHVREEWDFKDLKAYDAILNQTWEVRATGLTDPGWWYDYATLLYYPGDYSRAALAVLKAQESESAK